MIKNINFILCNFLFSDSDDEVLVKKSKKLPKGKETINKIKSPPRKGPVQYVSETGEFNYSFIIAWTHCPNNATPVGMLMDNMY